MISIEKHTQKMYDAFGREYQKSREEKKPERLFNEFLEVPAMLKAVGNIGRKRLLDIGCGAGIHAKKYFQKGANVEGLDISRTMIELARKNCPQARFKVGSITKLPYKNSSFDTVTASLCMDYIRELDKAFSEVNRVLKKGGLFYYSENSPINSMRERKETSALDCNAIGRIKDKRTNKTLALGTGWKEGVEEFEMVPGMKIKYYKRMFRTHLKAIVNAKFELIDIIDCKPTPTFKKYDPKAYNIYTKFPIFSIYVCRKK
jgi:ubiquinone/menaquinone biosynthesis C-methylase UbiE